MKTKYIVVLCAICLAAGFLAGRKTVDTFQCVRFFEGEPRQVKVEIPEPAVSFPDQPVLPVKTVYIHDTIPAYQAVDTAAIIAEYSAKREYLIPVFDNEFGKLSFTEQIQYNKIADLSYAFTPVVREIKIKEKAVWIPFAGISYNTLNEVSVSAGLFYWDMAIELSYITDFNRKGIGLGLKKKF